MAVAAPTTRAPDRARLERVRFHHGGGLATSLHVARFSRRGTRIRVVGLPRPQQIAEWCAETGVGHSIVGGFFVRPGGRPLGELRVAGTPLDFEPFAAPWGGRRGCVAVGNGEVAVVPRLELPRSPGGDLLEAGPLLLRRGVSLVDGVPDPEGFSSGSHQFDSDITAGRYPRAALGITEDELIAAAAEGRADDEAGLTLAELAAAMRALGALDAVNLDGGGSTSLVFDGVLRNAPREVDGSLIPGGRPVATALAFTEHHPE